MKIIKDKIEESMTPNEKLFFMNGKADGDKITNLMDGKAIKVLKMKFPDMSNSNIEEEDDFRELVTNFERAYIKGIQETLHNPIEIYI